MGRSIYCSSCKKEKEQACLNESRCKACKSHFSKLRRQRNRLLAGKEAVRSEREGKCDVCKNKQSQGISIAGRCNKCVTISNNERRHEHRRKQGLPEIGIRDSSFCHICNIPKIDGRCIPCRKKASRERKAKKREMAGKRPWGSGRPLTCYKCGNVKENKSSSYCLSCQSIDHKIRWATVIAPLVNQKEITLICECGKQKKSTRKFYCEDCLTERKRNRSRIASQKRRDILKENGFISAPEALSEKEKSMRKAARNYLNRLIRKGLVTRLNCEICGSNKNIEAHHDDYARPLEVKWLCRVHHDEHHHKLND